MVPPACPGVPSDPAAGEPPHRRPIRRYPVAIIATAAGVEAFRQGSRGQHWAYRGRPLYFQWPPVYGSYAPTWSAYGYWALLGAAGFGALGYLLLRRRRLPAPLFLVTAIAAADGVSYLTNRLRGAPAALRRALSARNHYHPDAHYITERGVRWWVRNYPKLHPVSVQNRTHPPGALVLWNWLHEQLGSGRLGATTVAVLTLSMAVPAWQLGRLLAGERAGRLAALLLLSAPAPLLFGYSNMDGVYGLLLSSCGAALLTAITGRSAALAAVAGFSLGLASFITYAAVFLGIAAAVTAGLLIRDVGQVARWLAAAAAGGLAALIGLRLVLGFDLFAANSTVDRIGYQPRPLMYWVAGGTPAVYLLFAGLSMAGLGLLGMATHRPVMSLALFAVLLVEAALPRTITGLYPGEIERTWLFTVPFFAAPAGAALRDWERATPAIARVGVPALLSLAVLSAIAIQAGYGVPD